MSSIYEDFKSNFICFLNQDGKNNIDLELMKDESDNLIRLHIHHYFFDDLMPDYFTIADLNFEGKTTLFKDILHYKDYRKEENDPTTFYDFVFSIPELKQFQNEYKDFERITNL